MAFTQRLAKHDDLAHLLALYQELSANNPDIPAERAAERFAQMLAMPGLSVFVTESAAGLIAALTLIVVPNLTRGARPFAIIENVVTAAAFRGRGIGKRLMAHGVEAARAQHAYKIMLMTGRTDEAVFAFYEACGFKRGTKTAFEMRFLSLP